MRVSVNYCEYQNGDFVIECAGDAVSARTAKERETPSTPEDNMGYMLASDPLSYLPGVPVPVPYRSGYGASTGQGFTETDLGFAYYGMDVR